MSSSAVILYDANNLPMTVQDGVAIPASTSGILGNGKDENSVSRTPLVESSLQSKVVMDTPMYGARYAPNNSTFTATAVYTRNPWGHRATSAVTSVVMTEANTTVGMNFSTAGATVSFKIVSTSVNDTAAGTGIRTIIIVYMADNGTRQQVSATMNGTTVVTVALSPSAVGVQAVYASSGGSTGLAAGIITVKNSTSVTTMGQINTGNTRTIASYHSVPNGKTLYVRGARISAKTTAALFSLIWTTWDYSTGATFVTLEVDRMRCAVGTVGSIYYDPPFTLKAAAGQIGQLNAFVAPDAVTASDYYVTLDLLEM